VRGEGMRANVRVQVLACSALQSSRASLMGASARGVRGAGAEKLCNWCKYARGPACGSRKALPLVQVRAGSGVREQKSFATGTSTRGVRRAGAESFAVERMQ
jgi:hypothetical protein